MKRAILAVIVCACLSVPAMAPAFNNARDYIPAPPGTLANFVYYFHSWGDSLNVDGSKVADVDLSGNLGLWREIYFFKVGPFVANAQFLVPFGNTSLDISTDAVDSVHASAGGIGDPFVLSQIWFINRPSTKTYLGFAPFVFFPLGNYHNDRALNMGANRWAFRTELNFTQGFEVISNHNAYVEVTLGGDYFGDNDNFGPTSATLKQDPTFNLEGHVSFDLTKVFWIAADYYGQWGGTTSLDGFSVDNSRINTQTVGGTLGCNIAPGWQALFQYKADVAVENGIPSQTVLFRLLYATDLGKCFR